MYEIKELRLGDRLCYEPVGTDGKFRAVYPLIREIHKISDDVFILLTNDANWILYREGDKITIKEQP